MIIDNLKWYKLPPYLAFRCYGRSLTVQPHYVKDLVVYGTVYGNLHNIDLLGSIVRVGYCVQVLYFHIALHDILCRKSNLLD